jgi:RimJ/RimL family protein N-acetyltransferase
MNDHAPVPSHPSDNWAARFANEDDAEGILDLLVATFGSWPIHEIDVAAVEHLRWKLFGRDDVRPWQIVVEDGGRIVGLNAVYRQRIKVKGQFRSAHQVVDLAVLPEYQNRGVISATRRFVVSDRIPYFDVLFGPRGNVGAREAIRRTGKWDPAERKNTFLHVLVLEGPVATPPSARQSSWLVHTPPRFDDRIRPFWEEAAAPFELISAHDEEFLNWRYCDPRAGRWTVHTAEEDGKLLGYVTYRVSNNWAYVGGLLALPDRLDVVASLLGTMMSALHQQGIPSVQCWSTMHHPYRAVLRGLGIEKKRRHVRFTIHAEGEDFSGLENPAAALHIVAGDTDLV